MVGCAYGLAAFWITAGFLHATQLLGAVVLSYEGHQKPLSIATWLVIVGGLLLASLAFWKKIPPLGAFLLAWIALSGIPVLAHTLGGDALIPAPNRNVMEFNAALLFALAAMVARAPKPRVVSLTILVLGSLAGLGFLRHAWAMQPGGVAVQDLTAFQISDWLARNAGGARVFAAGELNGALNLWTNVEQTRGGHQGISNFLMPAAHRELEAGCSKGAESERLADLWLHALNAPLVVVHGPASDEHFHWFTQPEKFAQFPVVWTNGRDDSIYRVPGVFAEAVVVDLDRLAKLPPMRSVDDGDFLADYVAWAGGVREVNVRWNNSGNADVNTALAPGQGVLVKTTFDRGWHASTGRIRPGSHWIPAARIAPGNTSRSVGFPSRVGCLVRPRDHSAYRRIPDLWGGPPISARNRHVNRDAAGCAPAGGAHRSQAHNRRGRPSPHTTAHDWPRGHRRWNYGNRLPAAWPTRFNIWPALRRSGGQGASVGRRPRGSDII